MPRATKGMTAQEASHGHPSAAHSTVAINRFHGVFRTGRHVAAGRRKHGRDGPLVSPQQLQNYEFGALHQSRLPPSGSGDPAFVFVAAGVFPDNFCSITAKPRLTSLTTSAKSAFSSDFLGLITTSAPTPAHERVPARRTASRKRRFMRLRSTAPPKARPTVNPTREPELCGTDTLSAVVKGMTATELSVLPGIVPSVFVLSSFVPAILGQ